MSAHNIALGRSGERRVASRYRADGYEIVAQNWRDGRRGEIDLVLWKDRVLVICEVKARSSAHYGVPAAAVDWRKQRRLRQLAAAFLRAHDLRPGSIRFDVAAVHPGKIDIIESAF